MKYKNINKNLIIRIQKEKGLTSSEMGELMGLNGHSYRTIKSSKIRNFSINSVIKLANLLNLNLQDFFIN